MDSSTTPTTEKVVKVQLKSFGNKKLNVVKAVKITAGVGLKEAKAIVDTVPSEYVSVHGLYATQQWLKGSGAEYSLTQDGEPVPDSALLCPHCGQEMSKNRSSMAPRSNSMLYRSLSVPQAPLRLTPMWPAGFLNLTVLLHLST